MLTALSRGLFSLKTFIADDRLDSKYVSATYIHSIRYVYTESRVLIYIFSYCHHRSYRESSLGFLSFLLSMTGVICFMGVDYLRDRCEGFITVTQKVNFKIKEFKVGPIYHHTKTLKEKTITSLSTLYFIMLKNGQTPQCVNTAMCERNVGTPQDF